MHINELHLTPEQIRYIKERNMSFKHPRRITEQQHKPKFDELYHERLSIRKIERFDDPEINIIDSILGFDCFLTLPGGRKLSVSEKCLSHIHSHFNTLTIELNQNDHETGNWYLTQPNLYCVAYLNEDDTGFEKWAIVDAARLALTPNLRWSTNNNNDPSIPASFKYINLSEIPQDCFIAFEGFELDSF